MKLDQMIALAVEDPSVEKQVFDRLLDSTLFVHADITAGAPGSPGFVRILSELAHGNFYYLFRIDRKSFNGSTRTQPRVWCVQPFDLVPAGSTSVG